MLVSILQNSEDSTVDFLVWRPEFDLGVPELDQQHRGLHGLVNAVGRAIQRDETALAEATIGQLLTQSQAHFDFEESLMQRVGYAANALHHEQHSELLASMARLRDDVASHRFSYNRPQTLRFLRDWFSIHIIRSDGDFVRFLKTLTSPGAAG